NIHNQRSNRTAKTGSRPPPSGRRFNVRRLFELASRVCSPTVKCWGIQRGEVPESRKMNDPDTTEVGDVVEPRTIFAKGFEEDLIPVHFFKLRPSFSRRHVDQSRLVVHNDSLDTFGIPEKLIHIVITDNLVMILFASNVLSVLNLVALITTVLIQWSNYFVQVCSLSYWLDLLLAFWTVIVILGTLVDEAQQLRHETDLIGFTPAQKVQRDLANTLMLRHLVHLALPSVFGSLQSIIIVKLFECLSNLLWRLVLFRSSSCLCRPTAGLAKLHIGKANSVIHIHL